ncbi:hypothetical protein EsDP_00006925 [Epichloe bromicola]|uniref:Translation initiation factor 3 C-terminal domain-containing protein n=1 Tax=Epichloe bromicola TaxID=79588 RepID=A0ABQ0CZ19_9HYPO
MRPAQCIYSSRRALCRVLVPPIERTRLLPVPASASATTTTTTTILLLPRPPVARGYASKSRPPARGPRGPTSAAAKEQVARDERGFDKRYTTQGDIERSGRDRPPQDHEITDPQIMVVDKGAAAAEGPLGTQFVLSRLEPHESLRMTQPYVPADADNGRPSPQFAVCSIVDKREEYERRKQSRGEGKKAAAGAAAAAARPRTKELELTWAIGEHDLATKMRQMGRFLAKGLRVEVLVARKKGGRQVDGKEAEGVVKRIRDEVERNAGRETKPATGLAGGTMRFYLEGKPAK